MNYAPDVPASLVKNGGRVVSPTAGEGPGRAVIMAAPKPGNLERLARLLALRVPVHATYALADAPNALNALHQPHPGKARNRRP